MSEAPMKFTPPPPWKRGDFCTRCQNTGEIECYCGGDLCLCGRQEITCPRCDGLSSDCSYQYEEDDQ